MREVAVVGAAALPIGRYTDTLEHEMLVPVLLDAIADAELDKSAIDSLVCCAPRPYTEQRYFGTFIAGYLNLPLSGTLVEVLGDGMTGGLAFDTAIDQILTGKADVAVALGVSRETHVPTAEHMELTMRAVGDVDFHTPLGVTPIAWYALNASRYLHDYDADRTDLAAVAVKNRRHAGLNPLAQLRDEINTEDVLDARPIVKPLHLLDVPPRSDGAAAVVLAEASLARSLTERPVYVTGRGFQHEGVHQVSDAPEPLAWFTAAEQAAVTAYHDAGIGPNDVDVAEVYAPCTIVEVMLTEALGFFAPGTGAKHAAAGESALGGRRPVSTDGGCLSRGHPPLVSPLYNLHEAVLQLRGDAGPRQVPDVRYALSTAELGDYNAALMHVLSTDVAGGWT